MIFSQTELEVISELGNANTEINTIAQALLISPSQVYRIAQKLHEKGIITLSRGILQPEMKTHINMLLKLLSRAKNLSSPLSGTGMQIFMIMTTPKTVKDIEKETGLHKTTILKKIRQARKMSLLQVQHRTYAINEKVWLDAKECLGELKRYEESIDQRIPVNSEIYFKNSKEILFSNKELINAEKTAFSAYNIYDIRLLLTTNYYYLPKKKLKKEEVFKHSLYVADKIRDTKYLIFVALFYLKYQKELQNITHQIVDNLKKIFLGEKIPQYPTLQEIRDRAEIYHIKI